MQENKKSVYRRASFEILIRRIEMPHSSNPQEEINWICRSLGFFETIDKGKTAATVFKEIVHATEANTPLTSSQLAQRAGMSRGSIINHLNNLLRSGLIVKHGRQYIARSGSMHGLIEELETDVETIFRRMKKIARELDEDFQK